MQKREFSRCGQSAASRAQYLAQHAGVARSSGSTARTAQALMWSFNHDFLG